VQGLGVADQGGADRRHRPGGGPDHRCLTIVFGELVPKRLGQMYPETVARLVARPMNWLSTATRPLVALLSLCTEAVLRLMGIRGGPSRAVTEEEIAASLEEGVDAGVIEAQEHQMVRNVFRLDDRQIGSMMIPRAEIVWLDESDPLEVALQCIADSGHTRFPVCRGSLDDVRGLLNAASLLQPWRAATNRNSAEHLERPSSCPRRCRAWNCWRTSALPIPIWSSSSTNTARCRA
jgi:putative hemolysin